MLTLVAAPSAFTWTKRPVGCSQAARPCPRMLLTSLQHTRAPRCTLLPAPTRSSLRGLRRTAPASARQAPHSRAVPDASGRPDGRATARAQEPPRAREVDGSNHREKIDVGRTSKQAQSLPACKTPVLKSQQRSVERHRPGLAHFEGSSRLRGMEPDPVEETSAVEPGRRTSLLAAQTLEKLWPCQDGAYSPHTRVIWSVLYVGA